MKRFILFIGSFVLIFCAIATLLLHLYEQKVYSCHTILPYASINSVTEMKDADADMLIVGNSRAFFGYNDSILSDILNLKCINIGWSGYPFDYQYHVMWKTYIKQNKAPKYILLEVGPWAFFDYVNPVYIIEMLPYIERPEFEFYVNLCPELSCWDKILLYKYAGQGREMINQYKAICRTETLDVWQNKPWNKDYVGGFVPLEHDSLIMNDFASFLQDCEDLDIQLIIVDSPMHMEDGYSCFEMDQFWELIKSYIGEKSIPILNYENLLGNDKTLFKDPMHLNKKGRDWFSTRIAHDLDSLGLICPK